MPEVGKPHDLLSYVYKTKITKQKDPDLIQLLEFSEILSHLEKDDLWGAGMLSV